MLFGGMTIWFMAVFVEFHCSFLESGDFSFGLQDFRGLDGS